MDITYAEHERARGVIPESKPEPAPIEITAEQLAAAARAGGGYRGTIEGLVAFLTTKETVR